MVELERDMRCVRNWKRNRVNQIGLSFEWRRDRGLDCRAAAGYQMRGSMERDMYFLQKVELRSDHRFKICTAEFRRRV